MDAEHRGTLPEWVITMGGSTFIIVLCVAAYRETDIRWLHFLQLKLAVSFVGTTVFFALAMAMAQPRYLVLFRQALHPQLHL